MDLDMRRSLLPLALSGLRQAGGGFFARRQIPQSIIVYPLNLDFKVSWCIINCTEIVATTKRKMLATKALIR